jgi:hypothetical protein
MANKFKVNQLILTNNTVSTTGNNIYINGLGAYTSDNPSGFIINSNLTSASGVLALSTQNTGQTLLALITASNAGVSSLNGQSGTLTLMGGGNVSVGVNGQNITISGNTGSLINYATINNLAITGSTLDNKINALSGTINPWINLTWANPLIWNVVTGFFEDRKRIILTGDSTLNISGLYNGWAGTLEIVQSGNSTTGYNLTLPSNTRVINSGLGAVSLTRNSGARDILGLEYNGTTLFCAIGNNFN